MTTLSAEILLDVHKLEPPEPFIEALQAINTLQPGQYVHMIHRLRPRLLYPELTPRGLESHTSQDQARLYHILIWDKQDNAAKLAAQQCILDLSGNPADR